MKLYAAVLVFVLVPAFTWAQQPGTKQPGTNDNARKALDKLQKDLDDACNPEHPSIERCGELVREQEKEMWDRTQQAQDALKEAKRSAENKKKMQSGDPDKQIDGAIDTVKQSSEGRGKQDGAGGLSTKITDQSSDIVSKVAHREKEILDNVGKATEITLQPEAGSVQPSFAAQSHQLHESRGSTTIEQRVERRADYLLSSPSVVRAFADAERREAEMEALRQQQIAEEHERALVEAQNKAKQEADAERAKQAEDAEEDAEEARAEARAEAIERRRRDAYMRQMYPWLYPQRQNSYSNYPYWFPSTTSGHAPSPSSTPATGSSTCSAEAASEHNCITH